MNLFLIGFFIYGFYLEEINFSQLKMGGVIFIILFLIAITMRTLGEKKFSNLNPKDAIFAVVLTWLIVIGIGTIPFLIFKVNLFNAIFESTSGFSTTGSTIFADLESLPQSLLIWRSTSQWIGGMGIIVLFVTIIPSLGQAGKILFRSEVPGVIKENITPHLRDTTKQLWILYTSLTVLLICIYRYLGLNWFESINHGFTTIATGGFSTKNQSMAYFSANVQWVSILFMIIGGMNFGIFLLLLTPNRKKILKDTELKLYFILIIFFSLLFSFILFNSQEISMTTALRKGFFTIVSFLTTTGYTNLELNQLSFLLQAILIIFFFIGGSSGSTSGGIKQYRILLIFRSLTFQIKKSLDPYLISSIKIAKKSVNETIILNVFIFVLVYIIFFSMGSIILFIDTQDFYSSFSLASATIGNIGPSLGEIGSNNHLSDLSNFSKLFCCFLMVLGRLELFTLIAIFHPQFWKKF